jgi:hypothetical protein
LTIILAVPRDSGEKKTSLTKKEIAMNKTNRKYLSEYGDNDANRILEYMLTPENVTSFSGVIHSMVDYFTKWSDYKGEEYYHPVFQEWFETEALPKMKWDALFEEEEVRWKESHKKAVYGLKNMTVEDVLKVSRSCDGHRIEDKKWMIEQGLDEDVAEHFTTRRWSDRSDYKSSLFDNDGNAVDFIEGIYGSSLLYFIADTFKLKYDSKSGRGSQAYSIRDAIEKHFKVEDES